MIHLSSANVSHDISVKFLEISRKAADGMESLNHGLAAGAIASTITAFPLAIYTLVQEDLKLLYYVLQVTEFLFPFLPQAILVLTISAIITLAVGVIWINVIMAVAMMMGYVNSQTFWMRMLRVKW